MAALMVGQWIEITLEGDSPPQDGGQGNFYETCKTLDMRAHSESPSRGRDIFPSRIGGRCQLFSEVSIIFLDSPRFFFASNPTNQNAYTLKSSAPSLMLEKSPSPPFLN